MFTTIELVYITTHKLVHGVWLNSFDFGTQNAYILQKCYVYVSAKLRCVLWCKNFLWFVLLSFELLFGLIVSIEASI